MYVHIRITCTVFLYNTQHVNFVPLTFVLPHDLRLLKREWEAGEHSKQKWILKPVSSTLHCHIASFPGSTHQTIEPGNRANCHTYTCTCTLYMYVYVQLYMYIFVCKNTLSGYGSYMYIIRLVHSFMVGPDKPYSDPWTELC